MPSEYLPGESVPGERRPAVVYVGPLDPAREPDALESPGGGRGPQGPGGGAMRPPAEEALRQAAADGLTAVEPVAGTVAEADAQLAAHPGAVLLVHPGTRHHDVWPAPGRALWGLLRRGAVLRPCGAGSPSGPPAPPHTGGAQALPALLVVDFPTAAAEQPEDSPRVAECRACADRLGLRSGPVLATPTQWALGALRLSAGAHATTVIVHPEAAPPDPASADGLVMRWLRAGHEIRPVRTAAPDRKRGWEPPGEQEWERSRRRIRLEEDELPAARARQDDAAAEQAPEPAAEQGPEPGVFLSRKTVRRRAEVTPEARRAEIEQELFAARRGDDDRAARLVSDRVVGAESDHAASVAGFPPSARLSRSGPPYPPVPVPRRSGPLPHDGLFIRRNNAFGTRSVLGVRDLIEQGVIIGQEQIRFDDFVAARTDQVPGPGPGEAVAVSHGLTAVPSAFKADEATTHLLELTLRAGDAPPAGTPREEPLPVNFVFVVDTSYSMRGEKLDTVRQALQGLYDRLRPADCLGIITFDTHVRTPLAAVPKRELPPERFAEVVSGLTASGGTDIHLGVQYGLSELRRRSGGGATVDCLYLFSDGDPTSGLTDWVEIRTRIAAELRGDVTLSCFGFGSDARMPELAALAGLSGGHSTFVTRPEQIGTDLLADLNRRDHLAAIDIQLRLDIAADVEIRHLYGHDLVSDPRARQAVLRDAELAAASARAAYGAEALPDIITDEHGIRIFAPDLAFGETYWIVLEIAVPPGRGLPGVGSATVQFVDTVAREGLRRDIDLSDGFTLAAETVQVHAVGLWTSEVTFSALDDLYERDRDTARKRLSEHIQILKSAHLHLPAREFVDDQITLSKLATLAGALDTVRSYSDPPRGGAGLAPAMVAISEFGRVRSGAAWRA
ncbi:VWA domain-containing protein [Streptomyces sp. NPDC006552]|uniref:VWA domain-containing protein n=1 Tax=Streptomyces sp. NPDC006552 TaxID=3157179 RepID=UPI0033B1CB4D